MFSIRFEGYSYRICISNIQVIEYIAHTNDRGFIFYILFNRSNNHVRELNYLKTIFEKKN